jgi:hypothetical protein
MSMLARLQKCLIGNLPINLPAMSHTDNIDHLCTIVDQVHDPIVTHANTIAVRSLELGGARRRLAITAPF